MGRWAAKVFGFSFGIVFRFTECPFRQGSVARKVSTDSGTNENPPITHRHIDTSTRVHKLVIRFGSRIADSRKELVVRFGADCVGNARGAVLVGNLRQQKPRRNLKR